MIGEKLLIPDMPSAKELTSKFLQIDGTSWYSNFGPLSEQFESQLVTTMVDADLCDNELAVISTSNGTTAIELAIQALCLPRGSKVLVPAFTFSATLTAILRVGLVPVIVDVDAETWLLTPAIAASHIEAHDISLVLPVAALGYPQDSCQWQAFQKAYNLPVIIDAAGAFGSQHCRRGIIVTYSFHATKSLGIGEGGCVCSYDKNYIEKIKRLSNFGIEDDGMILEAGTNAKLSEYHAAVGLVQLERWKKIRYWRQKLFSDYAARLDDSGIAYKIQPRTEVGVPSLFAIQLDELPSDVVQVELGKIGVENRRWYCPGMDRHPAFGQYALNGENYASMRVLENHLIGLPFHSQLASASVEKIISAISNIVI